MPYYNTQDFKSCKKFGHQFQGEKMVEEWVKTG
jgi:hypothetical protein